MNLCAGMWLRWSFKFRQIFSFLVEALDLRSVGQPRAAVPRLHQEIEQPLRLHDRFDPGSEIQESRAHHEY